MVAREHLYVVEMVCLLHHSMAAASRRILAARCKVWCRGFSLSCCKSYCAGTFCARRVFDRQNDPHMAHYDTEAQHRACNIQNCQLHTEKNISAQPHHRPRNCIRSGRD